MSSRICVKNLTKHTTEKDLKGLFGARGEITDAKVVKTATGKSRQFGFIGFRTHEQAKDCQEYFNNTFLKSAKIHVEMAVKIGDPSLPTKKSPAPKQAPRGGPEKGDKPSPPGKEGLDASKSKQPASTGPVDSAKKEFMNVMKSRGQGQFWANDDDRATAAAVPPTGPVAAHPETADSDADSASGGDDSDSDDDSVRAGGLDVAPVLAAGRAEAVSDMGYLKSKVKKMSEDSSDSEGEERAAVDGGDESEEEEDMSDEESAGQAATNDDDSTDESRLFVRNLPFSCSEEELSEHFKSFGPLTQVHIPLADTGDGRGKGYAFVQFMIPEHAGNAKAELDGTSFQGRLLHIIAAKKAVELQTDAADMAEQARARKMSSYQLKKEEERKKSASVKEGWNASHLRSDTVIEATADRYGVSRADIMDTSKVSGGELAVRLAISETQILQENREYFQAHGVDMSALESATSSNKTTKRSATTILVKNLPYDLVDSELEEMFSKYGPISAFLVPKSKSVALVDFTEPTHARAALKGLAYRRYHHTPLYLEWAPLDVVARPVPGVSAKKVLVAQEKKKVSQTEEKDADDSFSTLYVKNLSFSTTEEILRDHLNRHGVLDGVRTISLPKKAQGDSRLPMGFGFIEFRTTQMGSAALNRLAGSVLDGRTLELKPSDKRLSAPRAASKGSEKESTKLLVRNVAFQATQKEIRDLFSAFGSVKRVRIPKKMGGEHRGFAFVDFGSTKEAAAAKVALENTHLYGRHLVLEWASEEETSIEALRKRSQMDISAINAGNLNKKRRADGGDPFATDADMDMI